MSRQRLWTALGLFVAAGTFVSARAWSARSNEPNLPARATDTAGASDGPASAPEFPKDLQWVQGGPLNWADLDGRVGIVHFWTNGCINCIHNYPVYRSWQEKYDAKKVVIVGVHTPEFGWEAPAERVRKKAKENGLKFPIVLDPDSTVWKAWQNHYWPSIYLADKKGKIRYRWEGELHLDSDEGKRFAARIDELLAEGR